MSGTNSALRGQTAEQLAAEYLSARGLKLLARNYRCRQGELDLIFRDPGGLVVVEVRLRTNARYGGGAASVTLSKQQKLIAASLHYLEQHADPPFPAVRFDVVEISTLGNREETIHWIPNAFAADD